MTPAPARASAKLRAEGGSRCGEVERRGLSGHISVARWIYRNSVVLIAHAAAEEGGISQCRAGRFGTALVYSSTGAVNVTDNAPGSPQALTLTGTGTCVDLTPAELNFGSQPVNSTSLPLTVTFTNKGGSTVSIQSISIKGASGSDFAQTNDCGTSVARGASCFINVTFTPTTDGSRSADLVITDNGGGSPQTVALKGVGTF